MQGPAFDGRKRGEVVVFAQAVVSGFKHLCLKHFWGYRAVGGRELFGKVKTGNDGSMVGKAFGVDLKGRDRDGAGGPEKGERPGGQRSVNAVNARARRRVGRKMGRR